MVLGLNPELCTLEKHSLILSTTYQPYLAGFLSLGDWFLVCFLFYRTQHANSWTSLLKNSEKLVSGSLAPAFGTYLISLETGDQVCSHLPLASAHASAIFFFKLATESW